MAFDYVVILGLAAGAMTTASFLPQAIKSFKSRSTKDISLGYASLLFAGTALWIVYGALFNSIPVLVTNIVTFFLVGAILSLKIRYK